jgi:aconitate hydratase
MRENLTKKLIRAHLVDGDMSPSSEIALRIDQTLTQDATGTLVMLEYEAMTLGRVQTDLSAQYVDHNLLQEDYKNADDHLFLQSACQKYGVHFSAAGNGVSHPLHMEQFGIPGKSLVGSDSHTPAAGALGMLSFGAGGVEVALAMAGQPLYLSMPKIWGIHLTGKLPDWVSAKDLILEMLRRHGVDGGRGRVLEYFGPGVTELSAMDRHVIANMGTELGATSSVFPSDKTVRSFLAMQGRENDWSEWKADEGASYDFEEEIDLSRLEPLIACPSSPGNVVPVREVEGREIYQSYIGSSANPGMRDFSIAAAIVDGKQRHEGVSLDINPSTRQVLHHLVERSDLGKLIKAGARIHQAGCNGCIGMGQAPATGRISLRTVPRNFPGRSGTVEDQVYLCSPETAAASALSGKITDPRNLDMPYPKWKEPSELIDLSAFAISKPPENGEEYPLVKGPNIVMLPKFDDLPASIEGPVLLKLGNDVSTDEIMPAGARILPFRSNIPKLSEFVFWNVDSDYPNRALKFKSGGSFIVAGDNYGQGSSREHAAIAPRFLGLRGVIAKSFARIHRQNLINFGIVPFTFKTSDDYESIKLDDVLIIEELRQKIETGVAEIEVRRGSDNHCFTVEAPLTDREAKMILAGGILSSVK